jgi:hypothetical protein
MAWAAALAVARKRRQDSRRECVVRLSNRDDRETRHVGEDNGPGRTIGPNDDRSRNGVGRSGLLALFLT